MAAKVRPAPGPGGVARYVAEPGDVAVEDIAEVGAHHLADPSVSMVQYTGKEHALAGMQKLRRNDEARATKSSVSSVIFGD